MATTPPSPPAGGNRNRGPAMLAVFWTECSIALAVVFLRLYARILKKNIGADDWVMFLTMLLYVIFSSLMTLMVDHGGARHLYYLSPAQVSTVVRLNWAIQPFPIVGFCTGKISTALLILRFMSPNTRWRKWFLYISIGVSIVCTTLAVIFLFVQCSPPKALWEEVEGAQCWNPKVVSNYQIANASWNAFFDLALALLPITIIWNLQMALKSKIGLCSILGLGVFASISSCIKASKLNSLDARSDLSWATYHLYFWATTEMFIIVVLGSIPTLKPLYCRFIHGQRTLRSSKEHRSYTKDPYRLESHRKMRRSSLSNLTIFSTRVGRGSDLYQWSENDPIDMGTINVRRSVEISTQADEARNNEDGSSESSRGAVAGHHVV